MSLMIHAGAKAATYAELADAPMPEPTATHVPIAHRSVVDMVKYSLGFFNHEVADENYALAANGLRFFGILSLRSPHGDYSDTIGLRNSNDRTFPIGISFGSRVFVCDNLAFIGDQVIKRKHTANAKRDLPGLVAAVIEPLTAQRAVQAEKIAQYKTIPFNEDHARSTIFRMYLEQVINLQRLPDVWNAWRQPPHDWGDETAWRLFNAATYAMRGRVAENPRATRTLHQVIDGTCELVTGISPTSRPIH